jgi:hypothetical protein
MWEIQLKAGSHREAAEEADRLQRAESPFAKTFEVMDDNGDFQPIAVEPPQPDPEQVELEAAYRDVALAAYDGGDEMVIAPDAKVELVDDGAWVTAQVFVSDADAGIEEYDE